jgi:hypothetical protein
MPKIIFSKIQEPKKIIIPPGEYKARIVSAEESVTNKGDEKIELKLQIIMTDGSDGPFVWENLIFTEKASWKIQECLAAIGKTFDEGEEVEVAASDFDGEELRVLLEKGEYNGKEKMQVKRYIAKATDGIPF